MPDEVQDDGVGPINDPLLEEDDKVAAVLGDDAVILDEEEEEDLEDEFEPEAL
jgi:hypothetical protein